MGESALLVSLGGSISERTNARVHALAARLRDWSPAGLIDIVPAYSSILVLYDPSTLSEEVICERIDLAAGAKAPPAAPGEMHTVPVAYGGDAGPDLETLARERGYTPDEVVRLHSKREYTVYFIGFLPGFAYMGSVPPSIAAPRLATPRIRVPAGSVGIAGQQTGIYPFSSPGGWRLIGRTDIKLWDPTRGQPSYFEAGDRVRYVAGAIDGQSTAPTHAMPAPERPAFRVVSGGTLTTVQDQGRPGYASVGLSQGGWSDGAAAARANALVGNTADASALEMVWTGPTLLALRTVAIALDGADFGCIVDNRRVPPGLSWLVRGGSTIRFEQNGPANGQAVAYLAVSGGFDVPLLLHSAATCLPAGFGGFAGRALREGDVLGVGSERQPPASVAGRRGPGGRPAARGGDIALSFTRYEGPGSAGRRAARHLASQEWTVTARADRVGIALEPAAGESPLDGTSGEVISFGVVRGAIQIPPDGNPLLLGPDHQTTGGYPVAGVVCEAEWPAVTQLCSGTVVRFREVAIDEARTERSRAQADNRQATATW
jgi:KipI family sensor histidine kinase inhibitor